MANHSLQDGTILEVDPATPVLSDVLTAAELADFLGTPVQSLAQWRIPHATIGKRRFYFKQTVVAWLKMREGR